MTDNLEFIDTKFSSFKQQEDYKPPSQHLIFSKKDTKKHKKFVPGGEWANSDSDEETQKQ